MNQQNGGAPADGGSEPIETQDVGTVDAGTPSEGQGEPRQLTAEDYEARDRQKTAALREERARARTYQRELEDMRRDIAALRQNGGNTQARQMADQLEDIPDPEQDPMEALKALRKIASRFTNEQRETTQTTEKQEAEARFISDLQGFVQESEADFRTEHPDYDEACKHLKGALKQEFEDQGYRGPNLATAVNRELVRLAHTARKNGADPAEVYWRTAVRRGYTAKAGERQVEQLKRGQEHDVKVPRGGGRNNNFSRAALLDAKGDDFDKLWKVYEQQVTGGRS
jgi:uncharacterized protein YhaN